MIIPARYASTRLPGKPLLDICGKPMLQHVYEQATKSSMDSVIIATDDQRIFDQMKAIGCEICMTSTKHRSGTDRLAEVAIKYQFNDDDIVVNVQGDEPLIPPEAIDQVADLLLLNQEAAVSTLSTAIKDEQTLLDSNVVKVVTNQHDEALYFSRAPIPWDRDNNDKEALFKGAFQRHIGIYGYRVSFLKQYSQWSACDVEKIESLEQLRVLWHGEKIQVAEAISVPPEGVDTEADLENIRQLLMSGKDI